MTADQRAAWLAERRTGIGSSDAAACLNLSPWATPYSVAAEKLYGVEAEPTPEMEWGLRLEPLVAAAFAERTGLELAAPPANLRHPARPWMLANIDRVTADGTPVELKTSAVRQGWGASGTDDIPLHYYAQVTHQMVVAGKDRAYVAALLGGNDFRVYEIKLDEPVARALVEAEAALWATIQLGELPSPDWGHPGTPAAVARMAAFTDKIVAMEPGEAADHAACLLARYASLGAEASAMTAERAAVRARIEHLMGDAATLKLPDGSEVRRRRVRRKGYSVAESEYTTFTVKGARDEH
jgi:putative phage-type endonuclease